MTQAYAVLERPFMYRQLIWVDPRECKKLAHLNMTRISGALIEGDWDVRAVKLERSQKIRSCLKHWKDGVPWHASGIFEYMLNRIDQAKPDGPFPDDCESLEDLHRRYDEIDRIYERVRKDYRLKTAYERGVTPRHNKEPFGVMFHIGRGGELIFSGSGHHRLAMALALGIELIPATLGAVHPLAVDHVRSLIEGKKPPMAYQQVRNNTEKKFRLINSGIDRNRVKSMLDIGCNEGVLTELYAKENVFAVGLDVNPHFFDRLKQAPTAAYGILPMSETIAKSLPPFDMICLLSVHHQWHKNWGDNEARKTVAAIAKRAKSYFVIEFAGIRDKYGFKTARFEDNNEASVVRYATDWLEGLKLGGTIRYIGKNEELPGKEPYRYVFVVEKPVKAAKKAAPKGILATVTKAINGIAKR